MARRWRKRGRSGLWLPVIGQNAQQNPTDYIIGIRGYTPVLNDGSIVVTADEVTFDYTQNPFDVQTTAADFPLTLKDIASGNEWRLRRIVGKCHAGYTAPDVTGTEYRSSAAVEYAAGYIVLKTDEEGAPLTDLDEVNPLAMESAEDPWIWRRKWILRNAGMNPATPVGAPQLDDMMQNLAYYDYPASTAGYGSVLDGPHIDQKTNRVIHRQERLFFMSASRLWAPVPFVTTNTDPGLVFYNVDHRFFGSLSVARGNRRNASR